MKKLTETIVEYSKKYLIRHSLEFFVIVLGITFSFYLEDKRSNQELRTLSEDLKQNLLDEVYEIEKYMIEREVAFKGDGKLLRALQDINVSNDSLFSLETKPVMYGAALFNYRGFKPPVAFYNSLVNDGKIRYLESSTIKEELDQMHNVHFYFIDANVNDEAVAQRKVMDYFQINYPDLFIDSNDGNPNKEYAIKIKNIINKDITLRAILYQKTLAIHQKIVGFNNYNQSLKRIKKTILLDLSAKP
jgi:hypothetical protein|tara:strand:+ start:27 stop:764 length:738 start_codon:yes stop_codon:yes gene_type:complete